MEEKLFDLVGLGVPFYLGAATYGAFSWLDSNASDEATQVVSSWLHGYSRGKLDLGNIILNTFDRIYTFPLLRFRAFRRSVAISSILWVLVYLIPWLIKYHYLPEESELSDAMKHVSLINLFIEITFTLPFIILSDYISLFVVRKFLVLARAHPLKASVGAFIAGFSYSCNSLYFTRYSVSSIICLCLSHLEAIGFPVAKTQQQI